jgi:hypothetical protein
MVLLAGTWALQDATYHMPAPVIFAEAIAPGLTAMFVLRYFLHFIDFLNNLFWYYVRPIPSDAWRATQIIQAQKWNDINLNHTYLEEEIQASNFMNTY